MNSYPGIDSANMEADSYSYNAVGWSTTGGTNGRFTTTTYWITNYNNAPGPINQVKGYWGGSRDTPLGNPFGSSYFYVDYTNASFDSSYFANPEHIIDSSGTVWDSAHVSRALPGLLVYGEKIFGAPHSNNIYRIDSDLYYWQSNTHIPNTFSIRSPGNYVSNKKGQWFTISKLQFTGKDSPCPDFSLNQETMDNEMFTRYISDSAY